MYQRVCTVEIGLRHRKLEFAPALSGSPRFHDMVQGIGGVLAFLRGYGCPRSVSISRICVVDCVLLSVVVFAVPWNCVSWWGVQLDPRGLCSVL